MNQQDKGYFNELTSAMQDVQSVIHLDLSMSSYEIVPDEILNFSNLESLYLSWMKLPVPEWLSGLKNLKYLEILQHDFEFIPDELLQLPQLETLSLGEVLEGDGIKRIEDNLLNCPSLRRIELNFNPIEYLSNNLINHPNLTSISLSGDRNKLEYFPKLTNLKQLELEEFDIERPPAGMEYCEKLEELDLSHNMLKSIDLNTFSNLKELRLNSNHISSIKTDHISTQIKTLEIGSNGLTLFPADFDAFPELEELDLSHNDMVKFPNELISLLKLKNLNLRNNEIRDLPVDIGDLKMLEHLNVSKNMIRDIPSSFKELIHLKSMDISQNKLVRLPPFMDSFQQLEYLNLSNNQLFSQSYSFPESMGNLASLRSLDMGNNQLEVIPESLTEVKLNRLDLSNNSISFLPNDLSNWSGLRQIFLQNNPIIRISDEILELREMVHINMDHVSVMDWNETLSILMKLPKLKSISLRFNQINSIRPVLNQLKKLEILDLSRNQFDDSEREEIYEELRPDCKVYL